MEGIQTIKVELPNHDSIEIIPIGDVHEGDDLFDLNLMNDLVNYILEKPNRYVILNGDLINNAIRTSISDVYGDNDPENELKKIVNILTRVKDRIIGMGSGNHEERTLKMTGIDPSRYIAVRLGIEHRYCSNSFLIFIKFGTHFSSQKGRERSLVYKVFVQHGYGGGKKNGSKLNNLNDSDQIISDADLYIMGHTHTPIANVKSTFICDTHNYKLMRLNKYYLMHNAFLRFGGYGLRQGFAPAPLDITSAKLNGNGKKKISLILNV